MKVGIAETGGAVGGTGVAVGSTGTTVGGIGAAVGETDIAVGVVGEQAAKLVRRSVRINSLCVIVISSTIVVSLAEQYY